MQSTENEVCHIVKAYMVPIWCTLAADTACCAAGTVFESKYNQPQWLTPNSVISRKNTTTGSCNGWYHIKQQIQECGYPNLAGCPPPLGMMC